MLLLNFYDKMAKHFIAFCSLHTLPKYSKRRMVLTKKKLTKKSGKMPHFIGLTDGNLHTVMPPPDEAPDSAKT